MKQEQDRIVVITVAEAGVDVKKAHSQAADIAKKHGTSVELVDLPSETGLSTYKVIQKYLMDQAREGDDGIKHDYIDFVCVGNTGLKFNQITHEANYLGSTAAMVLRAKQMNCLFIPS